MGLIKELWIDLLIGDAEEFFKNDMFLSHGVDMTFAVDNDFVNFTYKGARPGITKNFRTDGTTQLPINDRTDVPDKHPLDNYSTDQMILPKVDLFGLPYDKKASLMEDGRLSLVDEIASEGMWAIGPAADAVNTPVVTTPGTNALASDNYRRITEVELKALRLALDSKYPGLKKANWYLVVDTDAYWDMIDNISVLQTQYGHLASLGTVASDLPPLKLYNFNIYCDNRTAWYNNADSTKLAYGATVTPGTHYKSAVAYVEQKTFAKALGSTEMFETEADAGKQADIVSFLTRAYVGPWGQTTANLKHAGAILRTP